MVQADEPQAPVEQGHGGIGLAYSDFLLERLAP